MKLLVFLGFLLALFYLRVLRLLILRKARVEILSMQCRNDLVLPPFPASKDIVNLKTSAASE